MQNVQYAKRNSSILKGLEYINLFAANNILNMQQPKSINMLRLPDQAKSVVEKVQSVVNYLVETAAVGDHSKEVKDKKKTTRGSNVRKKHTAVFKAKVIYQVQTDVSQDQIAQKYGISHPFVSKWLKNKDSIIAAAADKHRKLYAKQRKSTIYLELYNLAF